MTIREALTTRKEIPSGWLVTFLIGGLSNFAILVWMASAVVSDVNTLKDTAKMLTVSSAAAAVNDATQNAQIADHDYRLKRLEHK